MDHKQLREHVIGPVLEHIGLYSAAAEELLVLTAAHESRLGEYIHQVRGPAVGIYQMEPATHDDIWLNWLAYKSPLSDRIGDLQMAFYEGGGEPAQEMAGNLYYASAMARCHYRRVPEPLPEATDISGLASYWKRHYNTHLGAGTVAQALRHYRELVA